ncbi:MAG TPA: DUF2934 domain-containing protein [Devosiaceae bacterium]|jgi:hypothetical protein
MPMDEQIRLRAYQLWEQAGQPLGQEQSFWFQAVSELAEAQLAPVATRKPRKRKSPFGKAA